MRSDLLAVDWGTSRFRALHLDKQGNVLRKLETEAGILVIKEGRFEPVLAEVVEQWSMQGIPTLLCGMIGSRQGWVEVPYVACPADQQKIAAAVRPVATTLGKVWIVPGLASSRDGVPDVLRGEETLLLGVANGSRQLIVTPGTHSKWAELDADCITGFRTYMTGELFGVLRHHSILGRLMRGDGSHAGAFEEGVRRSFRDATLLNTLFSVRTAGLFGDVPPTGLSAYLSGLLIGAEIASAREIHGVQPVTIIGLRSLTDLYCQALQLAGFIEVRVVDGIAAAAAGFWRLWGVMREKT